MNIDEYKKIEKECQNLETHSLVFFFCSLFTLGLGLISLGISGRYSTYDGLYVFLLFNGMFCITVGITLAVYFVLTMRESMAIRNKLKDAR